MNVFLERADNGAYIVFATTGEARDAKNALDGVTYVNECIRRLWRLLGGGGGGGTPGTPSPDFCPKSIKWLCRPLRRAALG